MTPKELAFRINDAENRLRDKPNDAKSAAVTIVKELKTNHWGGNLFTAPTALRLVKILRQLGDENSAQEVLSRALETFPQNPEFVRQQHYLFSECNKYDQAFVWFHTLVHREPAVTDAVRIAALIGAGAAKRNLRQFKAAAKNFQEALDAAGGTASGELLLEQGWLSFYQKSYEQSFTKFQEAAGKLIDDDDQHWARVGLLASARQPDRAPSPEGRAAAQQLVSSWEQAKIPRHKILDVFVACSKAVLEELNLYPAALENAEHLLEFDKDNADGVYFKIGALKWLRRYSEAEKTFLDAPADVQTNIKVWSERANVFYEQKHFREAYLYESGKVFDNRNLTVLETNLKQELETDTDAREWTSVALRKMRKFDDARTVMKDALAQLGEKANFFGELGAIYYAERDYPNAIAAFDQALRLKPYDTFSLQWRVASLRKNGKTETAQDELNKALDKAPYGTRLWEEAGWLALDQNEFENAINHFDKAAELDPYVITRELAKIEPLIRLGRWYAALEVLQKLDAQFPNDAEIMEQRCWFHLRFGELEAAKEQVIKLRDAYPDSAVSLNALGGYELAMRNYTGAANAFREAINRVDYEPQYYVNRAQSLLRQVKSPNELGRLETPRRDELIQRAKLLCNKAVKLDQYHAKAWGCRGLIAFKEEEFVAAEFYFRKSIALSSNEGSHVELASLYCQLGRYGDASKELDTALSLNKRDARAYIELANVAVLKGDPKEAIRYCREAVFAEPKNPETHRALVVALMRAEQYEEAELRAREALISVARAKPWRLRLLLAQILVRAGDTLNKDRKKKDLDFYEEALTNVNEARNECGPNAELFFHAGIVQQRLEDYATSARSFTDCVKLNPQHYEAERYGRIMQTALEQQRRLFKVNLWFSYVLAVLSAGLLLVLWTAHLSGITRTTAVDQPVPNATTPIRVSKDELIVNDTLLNVMTPILLGMFTVAALLPNLSKLKLPGFEAEISDPKAPDPNISSGPRGDIKFGSSLASLDIDPR